MQFDPLFIGVFAIVVVILLILDLKIIGGKKEVTTQQALIWTLIFIASSLAFGVFINYHEGSEKAMEFFTAYAIEKTLSVDNLFVFILVFGYFKVPKEYHHKVLFYGIMGAIILRAIFIFAGSAMIQYTYMDVFGFKVNIILTIFGLILIWKGYGAGKEALDTGDDNEDEDFSKSPGAKFIYWITGGKVINEYDGDKFFTMRGPGGKFTKEDGIAIPLLKRYGTLLLVVVAVIEFTDLVFAVDSIPAIFSVTQDKWILYTSNIFAILGLRSMYFLLANLLPLFRYLNHGLAIILVFIGAKMVSAPWIHISGPLSLYIVLGILSLSIIVSLLTRRTNV